MIDSTSAVLEPPADPFEEWWSKYGQPFPSETLIQRKGECRAAWNAGAAHDRERLARLVEGKRVWADRWQDFPRALAAAIRNAP